jgi:hypothetical protein
MPEPRNNYCLQFGKYSCGPLYMQAHVAKIFEYTYINRIISIIYNFLLWYWGLIQALSLVDKPSTTSAHHQSFAFSVFWARVSCLCPEVPQTVILLLTASCIGEIAGMYPHAWLAGWGGSLTNFCLGWFQIMILLFPPPEELRFQVSTIQSESFYLKFLLSLGGILKKVSVRSSFRQTCPFLNVIQLVCTILHLVRAISVMCHEFNLLSLLVLMFGIVCLCKTWTFADFCKDHGTVMEPYLTPVPAFLAVSVCYGFF